MNLPLARGPIPALPSTWFDASAEDPGFADDTSGSSSALDSLESQMDAVLGATAAIDSVLPDLGELAGLALLDTGLPGIGTSIDATPGNAELDAQTAQTDASFVHVYNVIPGEAWGPPLPPELGNGAPPPPIATRITTGGIKNVSNPGSPKLFAVGDSYEWDLAGFVNFAGGISQGVLVHGFFTKDGVPQLVPWNKNADTSGNVQFTGTWGPGDVGHWSGYFDTRGTLAGAQYLTDVPDWDVQAAPVPQVPVTGPPGVTIDNLTRPGAQDFRVGEQWAVSVYGNPGADVIVSLIWNGSQLTPTSVGTIDAEGVLQISGTMAAWQVGTYVETYIVNGVPLPGTLNFTVS